MERFDIEFNHTDAEIAAYADRCGCSKCERYRGNPAHSANRAADIVRAARPAPTQSPEHNRQMGAPLPVAQQAPRLYCECPIGTRPAANMHGVCPACQRQRRPRGTFATPTAADPLGIRQVNDETAALRAKLAETEREVQTLKAKLARTTSVVAGAKANAQGVFLGFAGLNPVTRATLAEIVAEAKAPAEWLPPVKSAHAQAGRAVGALTARGYVVRAARVPKHDPKTATAPRNWRARWTVGAAGVNANVGGAFGTTLLVVTLTTSDQLVIEGREDLAAGVRADFDSSLAAEVYQAADVTAWLQSVLVSHFRAARVGGNWYVRSRHAAAAEALCTALAKRWGRDWLLPAIPMATTEQLCAGLVKNFIAEADAVLATYNAELAEAAKAGKDQIGTRRAASLLAEVRTLAERAASYAAMFGEEQLRDLRSRLAHVGNTITESLDGISQRFENIFDELRRDAARDGES